jgi:cobalamin biosynthesis protein CobT
MREAVTKVTQILSGRSIRVIQQGMTAKVEYDRRTNMPVAVYLPMIPDDASDELCDAVQGFLDHEVGHLLHTDASAMVDATKKLNEQGRSILNMVEDVYIERKQAAMWRGCGSNLARTGAFYLERFVKPNLEKARAAGDTKAELALLFPSMIRALGGQFIFKEFLQKEGAVIAPIMMQLADLSEDFDKCQSTADNIALTKVILDRLKSDGDGQGEDAQESDGGEGDQSDSGSKGKGKKSKKSKKDKGQQSEEQDGDQGGQGGSGDEEGDQSESESESGSGDGEQDQESGEGEGQGQGADGESDDSESDGNEGSNQGQGGGDQEGEGEGQQGGQGQGESEGDESGSEGSGGGQDTEDSQMGGESRGNDTQEHGHGGGSPDKEGKGNLDWSEIAAAIGDAKDFDAAAADTIGEMAVEAAKDADYLPFTTEHDRIEKLPIKDYDRNRLIESCQRYVEDPVTAMVSPMQKELERAIAARSASTYVGGYRSGRLNSSALARLKFNDDRVFRRKTENHTKDVSVELVIDISGSMSGSKVMTAAQAAFALSSVLERLKINHEVICFTTGESMMSYEDVRDARDKGISYSRIESIIMPIIKGADEPLNSEVRARFGALPHEVSMACNVDGESIEYAARRLASRKAARHVMIVLSDGEPAGHSMDYSGRDVFRTDLKRRVKKIEGAGIDVVGIGIESNAVRNYYKKNVVLSNVAELPTTVIKELRGLLIPS